MPWWLIWVSELSWSDWWAAIQGAALTAAALVAGYQLWALRRDQKAWRTLEACEKYDSDPILHNVLMKLRDARDAGGLKANPRPYRAEVTILFNYLEGIAVGAFQGFYREDVVRDHLETIIKDHVCEFLDLEMARRMELNPAYFENLTQLSDRWGKQKRPTFRL